MSWGYALPARPPIPPVLLANVDLLMLVGKCFPSPAAKQVNETRMKQAAGLIDLCGTKCSVDIPAWLQATEDLKQRELRSSAPAAMHAKPKIGHVSTSSREAAFRLKRKMPSDTAGDAGSTKHACGCSGDGAIPTTAFAGFHGACSWMHAYIASVQVMEQLMRLLRESEQGCSKAVQEVEQARRAAAEAEHGRVNAVQDTGQARRAAVDAERGRVNAVQEAVLARRAAAESEQAHSKAIQEADRARRAAAAAQATVKSLEVLRSQDALSSICVGKLLSDSQLQIAATKALVTNLRASEAALSAHIKFLRKWVLDLEHGKQAAQALEDAARTESAAHVKVLNKTVAELESELRKTPQQVAQLTVHISELQRQLLQSAGRATNEEQRRQVEADATTREERRHRANVDILRNTVSELELKLKCQQKEQSESISLIGITEDMQLHLRKAATKAELEGLTRPLLLKWHPDKHLYLGQRFAALADTVTKAILAVKKECLGRM